MNNTEKQFQESVISAVHMSICHNNSTPANDLLKKLLLTPNRPNAFDALIKYFETWGNLEFDASAAKLKYSKKHSALVWSDEYASKMKTSPWSDLIVPIKEQNRVLDADEEFRKVLKRLQRAADDPNKTVLHATLLAKVQEVINAYGITDECGREEKKGRALFDMSTKMTPTNASKFAKGCP